MKDSLQKNGFAKIKGLFEYEEIQELRFAFLDLLADFPDGVGVIREEGSNVVRSVMGWQRAGGVLGSFAVDERILRRLRPILGDLDIHQTKWNPKAPQAGERWDPHRGDLFWCVKDGVPDPKRILSVFVALTEQTQENGAVQVWGGSHEVSLREARAMVTGLDDLSASLADTSAHLSVQFSPEAIADFDERFERIQLLGNAGTVWILDAGLLHASGMNRSSDVRELVANVYRSTENVPLHPRMPAYLCENHTKSA